MLDPVPRSTPPFSHEWVELARELSRTELEKLVSFYNRGIRSGLSAASPRHVLEVMRAERRRRRLMVAQVQRSVIRTPPPPPDMPALN